jgi:hypoxanthine phosphoribosyltransferase
MSQPFDVLLTRGQIAERVEELGREISEHYAGRSPVMIMVLHGALPFLADLVRATSLDLEVDAIALTRFDSGATVNLSLSPATQLEGRDVIIVEDIVDTGLTLRSIRAHLEAQLPSSVATATLLNKATRRLVDVPVEFVGFTIGDEFVVGFGMDWEHRFRNLPDIWNILDLEAFAADPRALELTSRPDGDRVQL